MQMLNRQSYRGKNKKNRNKQKPKIKKCIICNNQGTESDCSL